MGNVIPIENKRMERARGLHVADKSDPIRFDSSFCDVITGKHSPRYILYYILALVRSDESGQSVPMYVFAYLNWRCCVWDFHI